MTSSELLQLADNAGIDIPPELDRVFIIEELLENEEAEEALEPSAPVRKMQEKRIAEPVPLPEQYNITFIEVMLRDPLWAFAFWEVRAEDKEYYEKADEFGGYLLRVLTVEPRPAPPSAGEAPPPAPGPGEAAARHRAAAAGNAREAFTIPVDAGDNAWYIGFPPEGGRFKIALCALCGGEEIVLAVSLPFTMPRLLNPSEDRDLYQHPLLRLSGIEDFAILRNREQESYSKWA